MDINQLFPSKYLKGADLKAPTTVTIAAVKPESMYKPGEGNVTKYVLYVVNGSKGVVLSRPLALQIAQALGEPDTDNWPGRRVVLFPVPMTVAGAACVAIRARAAAAQEVKA